MFAIFLDSLPSSFKRLGVGSSKGYEMIAAGEITEPVHIGRSSRLPRHEVDAIAAAIIAGATRVVLRALCAELMGKRAELAAAMKARAMAAVQSSTTEATA
ncbi:MAG: hypothetical protein HY943_11630 [Gammaproteobacteria bacterium]|nr:hypothetical protein [Gammaproteobacteria bacterium]